MGLFSDITPTEVTVSACTRNKYGAFAQLALLETESLCFQSPIVPLAFDTKVTQFGGSDSCNIAVSLVGEDGTRFKTWLEQMSDRLNELVRTHAVELTGAPITDTALSMFKTDARYPDSFRGRVEFDADTKRITIPVVNKEREEVTPERALKRGTKVALMVTVPYIFIGTSGIRSVRIDIDAVTVMDKTRASFKFN